MSKIHGKDTKPEVLLRKELWHRGWRYRKNFRKLPGSPDIVMTKYRLCIFVDSEFFHGKGFYGGLESKKYESLEEQLKHSNHPDYWLPKIKRNMERDQEVDAELTEEGWHIIHFWSKDVMKHTDECVHTVEETLATLMVGENAADAEGQEASGTEDSCEEALEPADASQAEEAQEDAGDSAEEG
jgi:DNA mismatch endonuclease (patch repair protein)